MNKTKNGINGMSVEDLKIMDEIIDAKLQDAEIPGFQAEFDPMEAERIGAFEIGRASCRERVSQRV